MTLRAVKFFWCWFGVVREKEDLGHLGGRFAVRVTRAFFAGTRGGMRNQN